ncbi:MAG: hypothetical protein IPJ65_28620 [Archangiaceae bacterium]|nr:hypothetical protein [Archangiaceae bacterium]
MADGSRCGSCPR